jgi:polyisoprenoid-binding protein YceI
MPEQRIFSQIRILEKSKLFLEGESNVNEFTCDCNQQFVPMKAAFELDLDKRTADFSNMRLQIKTAGLDCGNKTMNKDLQKTLHEDKHPFIEVILNKVYLNASKKPLNQYWTHYLADTHLKMVGKSHAIKIPVMAKRVGANTYQFKSFYEIRLSDFGIEAPTALLGLVKVSDVFVIHFDLYIEVE